MLTPDRLRTLKWCALFSMIGLSCSTLETPSPIRFFQKQSSYPPVATIHVVKKGETLYSIATHYQITVPELQRLNHLTDSSIQPGQVLRLSAPTVTPPTPAAPPSLSQQPTRQIAPNNGNPPSTTVTPATESLKNKHCAPPVTWHWPASGAVTEKVTLSGNQGISIAGYLGQPVYAAASGIVTYSGVGVADYDNLITIQHNDAFLSVYAYNRKRLVRQGAKVKMGQKIAEMGMDVNKQPSLHFEIRCHGKAINPLPFLR